MLLASINRTVRDRSASIWLTSLAATMSPKPTNWLKTGIISAPVSSSGGTSMGRCTGKGENGSRRFALSMAARWDG